MWEAFQLGAPVMCSNVTSLPDQAGGAARLFDPTSVLEMAEAVLGLWDDAAERERLRSLGRRRVQQLTWAQAARRFRAYYRFVGKAEISDTDKELLGGEGLY